MASLLAQLPGPINLRLVLSDLKFADILHDLVTAKGNRSGVPRALAVDRNETRELAGTLHIEGTSKDNAIAQIRAINALVTVGTTLTLQSTGATNAVTLNILPSRGVSQPLDELFEIDGAPVLASCAFSFTCEPYAYGPATIILNGAGITAPCIVDLGTIPGDYPAPISLSFATNAGGFHAIYCGLIRPGSSEHIGYFLREAEYFPWSGPGAAMTAPPYAHGESAEANASGVDAIGEVQDGISDGTYALIARCRMGNAADVGIVKPFTGSWAWPYGATWDYYELGHAHLPTMSVQYAGVSHHQIVMNGASDVAGHAITMDYLGFVPTTWGYFRWSPPARGDYATKLDVWADGHVFADDRGGHAYFKGAPISCVGPSRLVIFAEEAAQAAGCALGLTAVVTPRYALWR